MSAEVIEINSLNRGEGLKNYDTFKASSLYRKNHTVWCMPTRGMVPVEVVASLMSVKRLMNTQFAFMPIKGMEVGAAYDIAVAAMLDRPDFEFLFTAEDDNIQPDDVFFKLFAAIWTCIDCGKPIAAETWMCEGGHRGLDGISGLYFTKSDPSAPNAYGDPAGSDMLPRDLSAEIASGAVVEVNGIAQGCALYRRGLFERVPQPWFRTLSGAEPARLGGFTQDLYFCRKAKEAAGARFAVHCGVTVGHIDVASGRIF